MSSQMVGLARRTHSAVGALLGVLAGLIVALVALAFLWPVATADAHDLPVGIVGDAAHLSPDLPIDPTAYDSRAQAVQAVRARQVDGALVLGHKSTEVLVASADGTPAVSLLEGVAREVAGGTPVRTVDVVPLSADDPTGAGLNAMGVALVLGGVVGGAVVSLLVVGAVGRLLALSAYAVLAGVLVATVTGPVLGILGGHFSLDSVEIGIGMLATASTIVGLNAVLGLPGIGLGAVITMLIGNPISGTAIPRQFIAGPWGDIGQYFVSGSAASLIRESNYFPSASTLHEWSVLLAWTSVGVLLSVVSHLRSSRGDQVAEAADVA